MRKQDNIKGLCEAAILKVEAAINAHEKGEPADLSIPFLKNVRGELTKMSETLKPSNFKPSYPKFMMDWADEHGLVKYLSEVAYQYGRLKG